MASAARPVICFLKIGWDKWLLTTIKKITKDLNVEGGISYDGYELQEYKSYYGRLIIQFRKTFQTQGIYYKNTFEEYRETQDYKTSILSTAKALNLSKASVTSYLPYKKGVYYPSTEKEKISVGAERQRRYRAMKRWRADPTEENFWGVVLAYAGVKFKTYSGLPFSYEIKKRQERRVYERTVDRSPGKE